MSDDAIPVTHQEARELLAHKPRDGKHDALLRIYIEQQERLDGERTRDYELAARVVETVCNDRRGLHWDFDDGIKADLRASLARLIRCAVEGTTPADGYEQTLLKIAKGDFT